MNFGDGHCGHWRWTLEFEGGFQDPLPYLLPNGHWQWIPFFGGATVHLVVDLAVDISFTGSGRFDGKLSLGPDWKLRAAGKQEQQSVMGLGEPAKKPRRK